jgi:hypothetical protein
MPDPSVDPVAEPAAYQALLLSLLGGDDAATVQSGTPAELRALVEDSGDALRARPEPREWSVLEVAGHLLDAEIVCAARYRWILAHDRPELLGYDQDLWVTALGHGHADEGELLGLFEVLRAADVALWRRSSPEQRARAGRHLERGEESFDLLFRMMAGHDRFHMAQARRALDAARGARAGR